MKERGLPISLDSADLFKASDECVWMILGSFVVGYFLGEVYLILFHLEPVD